MRWLIDYHSGVPVYLQVVQQAKAAIAAGALRDGEQLPSVRVLAESLKVNRNTIAKAWSELEREGVIVTRLQGSTRVITLSPWYVAAKELDALLWKLGQADTALQKRLAARRRRPRQTGKAVR